MALVVKTLPADTGDIRDMGSISGSGRSSKGGNQPTPIFLPRESHGQWSLVGYSPWGRKESDMTEATWQALTPLQKEVSHTLFN